MQEKKALTRGVSKRYQKAGKREKTQILDELVKTTTVYMFVKTVRLKAAPVKRKKGGGRKPVYTGEFVIALCKIWAFFWYRCGKILAPFIREQMNFLEPHFQMSDGVRKLLLSVSPSTIDRCLKSDKKKLALKGKCGTKPGKLLKKQIPIRTYYADEDNPPGFFQTDTVHHCGPSESGEFCLSLTATDVFSGRIELRPTLNKAQKWVFEGMADIKSSIPFPFLGMDSDNGSEFINVAFLKWCKSEGIQFARSRAYKKMTTASLSRKIIPVLETL